MDLDFRQVYLRLINRIEGHICICFVAYTVMLELEASSRHAAHA